MSEFFDNRAKEYYSNHDLGFLQDLSDEIYLKGFDLDNELDKQDKDLLKNEPFLDLINANETEVKFLINTYINIASDANQPLELRRKYAQAISAFQKISKNK